MVIRYMGTLLCRREHENFRYFQFLNFLVDSYGFPVGTFESRLQYFQFLIFFFLVDSYGSF